MKTSAKGRQFIAAMEGTVLHVYLDSADLPTAGVGHLLSAAERNVYKLNDPVTKAECDAWLVKDLKDAEAAVNESVTVKINQNQFDAMVSLAFNIGTGAFSRSVVVRKCNQGDTIGAANAFQSWNKATVKGKKMIIEGLVKRRNKERQLFLTPESAVVPVERPIPQPDTHLTDNPPVTSEVQPPTKSKLDTVNSVFVRVTDAATSTLDRITAFEGSLSKSRLSASVLRSMGILLALFTTYWPYIVAGIVIILLCEWFMRRTDK